MTETPPIAGFSSSSFKIATQIGVADEWVRVLGD
jgi:hypothetical protein